MPTHLRKEVIVHVDSDGRAFLGGARDAGELVLGAVPRVLLSVRIADHLELAGYDLGELPTRAATQEG